MGSGQLRGLREPGRDGDQGGTVRRPEPSAPSAGASRSLQQRRPNQSPRSRRGQTSPEMLATRETADGSAGARRCGVQRSHIAEPACIRGSGPSGWCAGGQGRSLGRNEICGGRGGCEPVIDAIRVPLHLKETAP